MTRYLKTLIAICFCALILAGGALAQTFDLQSTLDEARTDNGVIGMGVIVMRADGTYDLAVSGERVKGSGDPVQPDDAWHIGSNTKSITALLYARLVDLGFAKWGATLPELFPEFSEEIDPAWSDVTIEDLFAHRHGAGQLTGKWLNARRADDRSMIEQRLDTVRETLKAPPPRSMVEYSYSNRGYIIAGAAIEALLKRSMDREISWEEATEIFVFSELGDPIHKEVWNFGPPSEGIQGHRSLLGTGFFMSAVGTGRAADNPRALGPAGTLNVPLLQHGLLLKEYLRSDSALIPVAVREKLLTPYPQNDPEADYAMGWGIRRTAAHGTYYGHGGSNSMWLSDVRILPDYDIVVIVNSNHFGDYVSAAHQQVLYAVLNHYKILQSSD